MLNPWEFTVNLALSAAAKDKSKETLFIFLTAPGNFIAANFTGQ